MDINDLTAFDKVVNFNEDFASDYKFHKKTYFPTSSFCNYSIVEKKKKSQSLNDNSRLDDSFTSYHNDQLKLVKKSNLKNLWDQKCERLTQSIYLFNEPLKFISYQPVFNTVNFINLYSHHAYRHLKCCRPSFINNISFNSSIRSQSSDARVCALTKQKMMSLSSFIHYKNEKKLVRSFSETSLQHIYILMERNNDIERKMHKSLNNYEKELIYLKKQVNKDTEETEKIVNELNLVKYEEKQLDNHLYELTRDGLIKADIIAKLKEKVSELYAEMESLRSVHLQAIYHQNDLQKEIENLRYSRDWYADQLLLTQSRHDHCNIEPIRIYNLLKDNNDINHRLIHENACLQAQLACTKASLIDTKRNLIRQLESIRIDILERETIFQYITNEKNSFENRYHQQANEIIELHKYILNLQMKLTTAEEYILYQKNKLLNSEKALKISENKYKNLLNKLNCFEREYLEKENYLNNRISKYNIILDNLKDYNHSYVTKDILINEILEEKTTLTLTLSAIQHEKEILNNYLIKLKNNLMKVEKSFSVLQHEIELKSMHIIDLTNQRDNMMNKIKILESQLNNYYKLIKNLSIEKQEIKSIIKYPNDNDLLLSDNNNVISIDIPYKINLYIPIDQILSNSTLYNENYIKSNCLHNYSYPQLLSSSDMTNNVDSSSVIQTSNTSITVNQMYFNDNNQHQNSDHFNIESYKIQDNNFHYDVCSLPSQSSYISSFKSYLNNTENKILVSSPSTEVISVISSSNLTPMYMNCSIMYKHPSISSEQMLNEISQQNFFSANDEKNICITSSETENDPTRNINQNNTYTESSDYAIGFHNKKSETKKSNILTKYFAYNSQNNYSKASYCQSTLEVSSHENTNHLTHYDNQKGLNSTSYDCTELDQLTSYSMHNDHEQCYQPFIISEPPNETFDSGIHSASQSDMTTRSSLHKCNESEIHSLSTFNHLKNTQSEQDCLSMYVSGLNQNLNQATDNIVTFQKGAEIQTSIDEHEISTVSAHQLVVLELNNTKAELTETQKLVNQLRQEIALSREEVATLRAHEDEKQSFYESEINSMKTIIKQEVELKITRNITALWNRRILVLH
ncbi:unnamed protein product [Heterobilharzia americana]|nr:unnamed protein product [Heterobilharzia americana]